MHFISANNFDISDAAVTKILESKDASSGVTSFEGALEYYDSDSNEMPEVKLIDILKEDNSFLTSRGRLHFSGAKAALTDTLDEILEFMQAVESDGGNPRSAFYVAQDELAQLKNDKKVLLSMYNNLIQGYHPSITIDGKSGAAWYSLAANEGETLAYNYQSSIRNLGPFDYNYVYTSGLRGYGTWNNTMQHNWTEYLQESFTKVNLGAVFSRSLRDILTGGSVSISLASSDEELLESHVSDTGSLSSMLKSFVPDARFFEVGDEKVIVPAQVKVMSVPVESSVTVTFSLTNPAAVSFELTDGANPW